ncbi:CAP domain-containing protein [Pseudaminobacter soli (ex Zhang et al. 2022)]|nr:CAP domain-containing protein [Pseudaminobacter soli]
MTSRRNFLVAGSAVLMLPLIACSTSSYDSVQASLATNAGQDQLARIRSQHGLTPLAADADLGRAALEQARYMAASGRMNHTTGWGKDFSSRVRGNRIKGAAAENIAYGRMEPDELFLRWMNSAGHRRNMLDPRFSRFGLAHAGDPRNSDRRYWALVLGS